MSADDLKREQLVENMCYYGNIRFKQLKYPAFEGFVSCLCAPSLRPSPSTSPLPERSPKTTHSTIIFNRA